MNLLTIILEEEGDCGDELLVTGVKSCPPAAGHHQQQGTGAGAGVRQQENSSSIRHNMT